MPSEIFRTVHGSVLYGLNHQWSDADLYVVTDSTRNKARHSVTEEFDTVRVGMDHFLTLANGGAHQAVEALFSTEKVWANLDDPYRPMIESMRIGGGEVYAKYERTIRRFCHGDFKRRRHAVRLKFNLIDLRSHGRFNPRLDNYQISACNDLAAAQGEDLAWLLFG